MSEENVELMRRTYELWREGGFAVEAIPADSYAEDVEWDLSAYPLVDLPTRGSGRAQLFETFASYFSGWRAYHAEVRELADHGESVPGVLHESAKIAESDVALERDVFQVWTVRDGLIVRWQVFETRADALEAIGPAV